MNGHRLYFDYICGNSCVFYLLLFNILFFCLVYNFNSMIGYVRRLVTNFRYEHRQVKSCRSPSTRLACIVGLLVCKIAQNVFDQFSGNVGNGTRNRGLDFCGISKNFYRIFNTALISNTGLRRFLTLEVCNPQELFLTTVTCRKWMTAFHHTWQKWLRDYLHRRN